jgi:hypothetical protein
VRSWATSAGAARVAWHTPHARRGFARARKSFARAQSARRAGAPVARRAVAGAPTPLASAVNELTRPRILTWQRQSLDATLVSKLMRTMKSVVLLSLATSSIACQSFPQQPNQAQAAQIVWQQIFAAPAEPPLVEWHEDVCPGHQQGPAAVLWQEQCFAGLTLDGDLSRVAWRGSFSQSAFAHELLHALQARRGVFDPGHTLPDWANVPIANHALEAAGL